MMWRSMKDAPRNGTTILCARNNGCSWDYYAVWWTEDDTYPWQESYNSYVEDYFDYWFMITEPYQIDDIPEQWS